MIKIYKLAANFNTVEFEITDDEILEEIKPEELKYDEDDEVIFTDEAKDNALKRILQREYDVSKHQCSKHCTGKHQCSKHCTACQASSICRNSRNEGCDEA